MQKNQLKVKARRLKMREHLQSEVSECLLKHSGF